MDIQIKTKFEQLECIKEKLEYLNFDEHLGCYVEKVNGKPVGLAAWMNGAWYGFEQAAKPQSVPEGFVVVPKEPTDEMWSSGIDAYTDAMESNKTMPAISIIDIYKAMLSASQESK